MIETISPEHTRFRDVASAAAASSYQAPIARTQPTIPVRPDAELIRSIGLSTDADAFRGSSPDLQALLDALLSSFGSDKDLPESEAADPEINAEIRNNNSGSREVADSLQQSANQGEQTMAIQHKVEAQDPEARNPAETESTVTEVQSRRDHSEQDVSQSENLSNQAQTAKNQISAKPEMKESDKQKLQHSADSFEQKAAAAESASRLHKVMIERVLRRVEELKFENEERRELQTVDQRGMIAA